MDIWRKPPGGFTPDQLRHRRRGIQVQLALFAVTVVSVAGAGSYGWVTSVQPVDRSHAVDLFRAGRSEPPAAGDDRPEPGSSRRRTRADAKTATAGGGLRTDRPNESRSAVEVAVRAARPNRTGGPGRDPERNATEQEPATPEEGVYSWATQGYEQVSSARREFPEETQRIISHGENESWTQHHYFSEERQIWSAFRHNSTGIVITQQRNKVTFGPVTRESEIVFAPPMLAAPHSLRTGVEWQGNWDGDTYGSYSGEVLERTTIEIDGESIDVWRMTIVINLRGEQGGRVDAEVWFAPGAGLTVKEHYVQDVESGGAQYHAEWMQTLKSLEPRQ